MRLQSRSSVANDDGLIEAAASGKRRVTQDSSSPLSPAKIHKRGSKKGKRSSNLESSSEDEEMAASAHLVRLLSESVNCSQGIMIVFRPVQVE